ncbi:MAG TPA: NAD(P)H-dependent oxidoreductase subunit E, partial [Thermoanaerobaculia bacterium]|nr:NAD(P)H-dependent oxidoreductase subunit E [Thermoanaerobaculia bacterium]
MDLHFTSDEPDVEEIAAVEDCLSRTPLNGDRRQYLLPVLHALQGRKGWVSPGALNYACRRLDVPPAEAFGVADFYALFQTRPHPPATVHVCDDIACRTRGAEALCADVEAVLGPSGESQDGYATWHRSPCLGLCERAPAALVIAAGNPPRENALAPATATNVLSVLAGEDVPMPDLSISVPQAGQPGLKLLARVGQVDPMSLDDYRAAGGFLALRRAIEMGAAAVVKEVVDSKLVGRGGAAFPTGVKWQGARSAALPRYLICNADESEPGTFKDRVLMENDPFSLIEAMTIAGFATGCEKGFLYLRGEYPLALARLENAIERCRERGYLGDNILGDGVRFDIELRRGAGAYICGEETALMNSLEGRRGEPRNKPPFPTQMGLFGRPTVINNVET